MPHAIGVADCRRWQAGARAADALGAGAELGEGHQDRRVDDQRAARNRFGKAVLSHCLEIAPLPGAGKFEFIPLALPQKTYIEVWFVPVPSNPSRVVVGGDSVIQMSIDGSRELGHTRSAPSIRELALPTNGAAYVLESAEDRIPLLSELVASRLALDFVPQVAVRTRQYESLLTRARLKSRQWKHTHR